MKWSFYRKIKKLQPRSSTPSERLEIRFTADTAKEAEQCRQSMIEEFGAAAIEVHCDGRVIPTDERITASDWKQVGAPDLSKMN